MPKLIIKREKPQRFTRQAILFWVLGLLPVVLLAGFLTGNLISQSSHSTSKAGQMPLLPLAPLIQPKPSLPNPSSNLPLPLTTAQPNDTNLETSTSSANTVIKPTLQKHIETPKLLNNSVNSESTSSAKTTKKPLAANTSKNKPNSIINQTNTNNQQNNRSRPIEAPSSSHKLVKSPQTVSESPRPRPVARANPEKRVPATIKSPESAQNERGSTNDYRLLEQSLGIPLQ